MSENNDDQSLVCADQAESYESQKSQRLTMILRYIIIALIGVAIAAASTYLLRKLGY